MELKDKNVLLIMPNFYSLKSEIESELIKQGAHVTYIESRVYKEDFWLYKTLMSFIYFIINPLYKVNATRKALNQIKSCNYDYLFAVGVYGFSDKLISTIRKNNSNIKTIYYHWDAFVTWDNSKYIDKFDVNYTFDIVDYNNHKCRDMKYLPLFYIESNDDIHYDKLYDISSIGTIGMMYKDRISLVGKIIEISQNRYKTFFWFYVSELNSSFFKRRNFKNRVKNLLNYALNKTFRTFIIRMKNCDNKFMFDKKISAEECKVIEASSKAILDVNIDNAGCAYRIISALSRRIKVITTNKYIVNEAFYSPNNICIIDRENPIIDEYFLNSNFEDVDITQLRIDNWLRSIFSDSTL